MVSLQSNLGERRRRSSTHRTRSIESSHKLRCSSAIAVETAVGGGTLFASRAHRRCRRGRVGGSWRWRIQPSSAPVEAATALGRARCRPLSSLKDHVERSGWIDHILFPARPPYPRPRALDMQLPQGKKKSSGNNSSSSSSSSPPPIPPACCEWGLTARRQQARAQKAKA
jgi:hypothetical protein